MTAALVLVVLVVSPGGGPTASAVAEAVDEALAEPGAVRVHGVAYLPPDEGAIAQARAEGARGIAEVDWTDERRQQVHVRVHLETSPDWLDRRVEFSARDAPAERARTVGFTIASMVPRGAPVATPAPAPAPAPAPPPPPSPSLLEAGPTARAPVTAPPPVPEPRALGSMELAVVGAGTYGGESSSAGVETAFEWRVWPHWMLRAELGWRTGDVTSAQARTFVTSILPGIAWRSLAPTPGQPFGFGARLAYAALREQLTRPIDGASPLPQWQSGVQALGEGSFSFVPGAQAFLAAGGEAAFGTLDVVVGGKTVAAVEPLRVLVEAGLRVGF